jgi:hypothetical protein
MKLKGSVLYIFLLLLFFSGVLIYYGFFYNNHLFQREQLQLFETTFDYFTGKLSWNGGFADYLGEFLVQFFRIPLAGGAIIAVLLALMILLTGNIFRQVTGKRSVILFSFLPAAGYFIVLQNDFYSFSGIPGFILALAGLNFYLSIKNHGKRMASGILLILIIYWLAGASYLTFTLTIIVSEIVFLKSAGEMKPCLRWGTILYLAIGILIPFFSRAFIIEDTLLQAFISESYYTIRIFFPLPLVLILASIPLMLILRQAFIILNFSFLRTGSRYKISADIISIVIIILLTLTGIFLYGDFKAEKQMAYDNLVYLEDWNGIVDKSLREQPSDRLSMVAVNLALAKTGRLSSLMFALKQNREDLFLDYERKEMTPLLASEPFYNLGLINFAQMFAMETVESTVNVKYPSRSFIRIASTYLINGQYDIALKYLKPLSHTIFYQKWADDCISLLNHEERIDNDPYWGAMRRINTKYDFYYNSGQMDVALRFLLLSNPENKVAYEYLLAHYLLQKNLDGFLEYIPLAEKLKYSRLPKAWEEAAIYVASRIQGEIPQLSKYQPGQESIDRIKSYAELFSTQNKDTSLIRREFGDTYWYYLHFIK